MRACSDASEILTSLLKKSAENAVGLRFHFVMTLSVFDHVVFLEISGFLWNLDPNNFKWLKLFAIAASIKRNQHQTVSVVCPLQSTIDEQIAEIREALLCFHRKPKCSSR